MGKITRSARGEIVDFNLIQIKQQLAQMPPPVTVRVRENYIDEKLKRRQPRPKRENVDASHEVPDNTGTPG